MKLALVTVNYNGSEKTRKLLESLRAQTDSDFQLFVVDNGSASEDVQKLRNATEASFLLIENERNLGFSGGNNVGIRKAIENGSAWVVLINNDTWVEPDFIARLKGNLSQRTGIVALPIQEAEGIAYGGRIIWLKPTLPHVYRFHRAQRLARKKRLYAIGAGMAISSQVFEKVGTLDERYFLYFEDADFCARAMPKGVPITPMAEPVIHHQVSSTTRLLGSALLLRYHARNSLLFTWKNGSWWAKGLLPFWSLYGIIFQSLKVLLMPSRRLLSRAITAGILDFYAGKFGHITAETKSRH